MVRSRHEAGKIINVLSQKPIVVPRLEKRVDRRHYNVYAEVTGPVLLYDSNMPLSRIPQGQ